MLSPKEKAARVTAADITAYLQFVAINLLLLVALTAAAPVPAHKVKILRRC